MSAAAFSRCPWETQRWSPAVCKCSQVRTCSNWSLSIPTPTTITSALSRPRPDQRQDARPALRALPDHLEDYDTIYLGYPNYWGTMPMCVFTFLASFDFTGKTIPSLLHP